MNIPKQGRPRSRELVTCPQCGKQWEGRDLEVKQVYAPFDYHKAGREGETYHCPECNEVLFEDIWRMS